MAVYTVPFIVPAAAMFAYVWSAGGYWHYVAGILAGVSLIVIFAERAFNKHSN
jgi:hypothetical protein